MGICKTSEYRAWQKDCSGITIYASENHADVIVFEYLEMKGKLSGKKEAETAAVEKTGYPETVRTSGTQERNADIQRSVHGIRAGLRMMDQEKLSVIREITACAHFRQEKDITVTCQHPIISEQDILSVNF